MQVTPYKIVKAFRYLKHFGPKEFLNHLRDRLEPEDVPYGPWYLEHRASEEELEKERKTAVKDAPLISVLVPVFQTPEKYLREMIESVQAQTYGNWELCIADAPAGTEGESSSAIEAVVREYAVQDGRIRYQKLEKNEGI